MTGLLSRAVANLRSAGNTFGDSSIPPNSAVMGMTGVGGLLITEQGALAISTVMSCARVLHDDIATTPFGAYRRVDKVPQPMPNQPRIVAEPFGPDTDPAAGVGQLVVSLAMRGNAYMRVVSTTSDGWPDQLQILHPDRVQPKMVDGRKAFVVDGKQVGPDDVKHIMGMSLPGAIIGMDPISYYRVSLQAASETQSFAGSFFKNGATPSGMLKVAGQGDRKKAREYKEAWEAGHAGVGNAHRIAVMFGDVDFKPLSVTPEQAQFLQTRGFQREDIAGMFGVPLHRIMVIADKASQGGGKGLDTQDLGYVIHTLLPKYRAIERCFDQMLPGGQATFTRFDLDDLLRANALDRAQIAQIHRLIGVRNRDEIRAQEGLPPIGGPDGQDYNIPFNTNRNLPPVMEPGDGPVPAVAPTDQPADGGTK